MVNTITFNPAITTNGIGSFNVDSAGFIAGTALDDPSARNYLAGGVLATTETLPMWGGVGIAEYIPQNTYSASNPNQNLGMLIKRATVIGSAGTAGSLTGFSVFNQAHAMVNTPQSPVPQAGGGGNVEFYRLGSGARIALPIDPALVSLVGSIDTSLVSWDFAASRIVKYTTAYVANPITGATWANTSGGQISYTVTNDLSAVLSAGNTVDITGVVSTGGTGVGYNGTFVVVSCSSTTLVVTFVAASSPGTYSSGGSVTAGGGALPGKILDLNIGNSMVPVYDPVTGFLTWNRSGSCAIVLI